MKVVERDKRKKQEDEMSFCHDEGKKQVLCHGGERKCGIFR